ncbi:MAG: BON domain-containing protein [Thermoanaerobaculia bacterium]
MNRSSRPNRWTGIRTGARPGLRMGVWMGVAALAVGCAGARSPQMQPEPPIAPPAVVPEEAPSAEPEPPMEPVPPVEEPAPPPATEPEPEPALQEMAVDDEVVATKILIKFSSDARLSLYPIDVRCSDGRVVLTGEVGTDQARDTAETLARQTEGVRSVDNRLTVR